MSLDTEIYAKALNIAAWSGHGDHCNCPEWPGSNVITVHDCAAEAEAKIRAWIEQAMKELGLE